MRSAKSIICFFFEHNLPKPSIGASNSQRGSTPLYNPYRFVPPQRVEFLGHFSLKTGIDFWSGNGCGIVVTTGVYERFVSIPDE